MFDILLILTCTESILQLFECLLLLPVVIIMKDYTLKPRVCTYTKLHVFVSNHNVISDSYDILLHTERS